MIASITKQDLELALAESKPDDNNCNCLISQVIKRTTGMKLVKAGVSFFMGIGEEALIEDRNNIQKVIGKFDLNRSKKDAFELLADTIGTPVKFTIKKL